MEFSSTKKKRLEKAVLQGTWPQREAAESVMGTALIKKKKKKKNCLFKVQLKAVI